MGYQTCVIVASLLGGMLFVPQYQYRSEVVKKERQAYFAEAVKNLDKAASLIQDKGESKPAH